MPPWLILLTPNPLKNQSPGLARRLQLTLLRFVSSPFEVSLMAQSAAADLPPHQGLFNLGTGPSTPAANTAPAMRFPGAAVMGQRIEPRLVATNPAPAPVAKPATANQPPLKPALSLAPSAAPAAKTLALPGGNAQVQPKPEAAPKRVQPDGEPMSRGRFLKTIEHLAKTEEAKAINSAVARVKVREVELAVQHAAKARARYLASVVDLGANRTPLTRANVAELAELRKAHEELEQGIEALTDAIREGLVEIAGVGE
jgi:hypothetical protein